MAKSGKKTNLFMGDLLENQRKLRKMSSYFSLILYLQAPVMVTKKRDLNKDLMSRILKFPAPYFLASSLIMSEIKWV